MTLQKYFFNKQAAVIKENLRHFWVLSLISMLLYLFAGVVPFLISKSSLSDMSDYLEMSLMNTNPFFLLAMFAFPVLIGVSLFKYLHNPSSVSIVHSMPFTRVQLFWGNFISGIILLTVPILITGMLYLIMAKPVIVGNVDIFTYENVLLWIFSSIIITIFTYIIVIFAGICSGNTAIHTLVSIFFIFLAPAFYATVHGYFGIYLKGYPGIADNFSSIARFSPLMNTLSEGSRFSSGNLLLYFVTSVVLVALSIAMYKKRKLERATDSIVFKILEPVLAGLVTFFGMTVMGMWFISMHDSDENVNIYGNIGYAVGTVLFFIISYMIIRKSTKIFTKSTFKAFIAYCIIAAIFISTIQMDVFNYGSNHPENKNITSAFINFAGDDELPGIPKLSKYFSFKTHNEVIYTGFVFKDKNSIKLLTSTQEEFAASDNIKENPINIGFRYVMNKNQNVYSIPDVDYRNLSINPASSKTLSSFKKLLKSKGFIENIKSALSYEDNKNIKVGAVLNMQSEPDSDEMPKMLSIDIKFTKQQIVQLKNAIVKDYVAQTDKQTLTDIAAPLTLKIYSDSKKSVPVRNDILKHATKVKAKNELSFNVYPYSKNTLEFLKNIGYGNLYDNELNQFKYAKIWSVSERNSDGAPQADYVTKISDPQKLKTLALSVSAVSYSSKEHYLIKFYYKNPIINDQGRFDYYEAIVKVLDKNLLQK